jgi:transposase InsO family protein
VRPAPPLICEFITERRQEFGVAPICRALTFLGVPIAPRTYWAHVARSPSKRALWDMSITEILAGYYEVDEHGRRPPESLYGSLKMWAHLQRQGVPVARCTIERLMRDKGWRGATRARKVRTTIADPAAERAPDLVKRQFTAACPDQLWVADFTYVPMVVGFGYTALVIDAFAGLIVGWECSLSKHTAFVESAIRQAVSFRSRQGHPLAGNTIHHSDAGSQYTAVRFGETLMLGGLTPSIGTVGDALDNALAETTIGLYKTECIRQDSPFRHGLLTTLADLEKTTSAWVHWYNNDRLMHRLGRRPPTEAEADYYATTDTANPATHTN